MLPILLFLTVYLLWLFRAYYDVAYMDQVQIVAGNMNNMLNHNTSLHDLYYRPPFLLLISNLLVFLNCKLFGYDTYLENIVSAFILAAIAYFFIKSNLKYFNKRITLLFSFIASFIIFCFTKWELSLWGGGFSHYMVVLFAIICVFISHKYYFAHESNKFINKYYIPLFIGLAIISALETTSYLLPFLIALLLQMLINYKLFGDKIILKKWRLAAGLTIGLIVFALIINYLAELYSIKHPYDAYGKVNLGSTIGDSLKKLYTEPMFVIKFFLIANAGNLIDKDFYPVSSLIVRIMPLLGLLILAIYVYSIYLFIKRKKIEGVFSINMILTTIIFYSIVLVGRLHFNDVYYGGSSRYSAATFTGTLGVCTFFILLLQQYKVLKLWQKVLYALPLLFILFCNLVVNKNEWKLAPYRKGFYIEMADNLKLDSNLESLMGYNAEITERARTVMIRNKLNVFKPQTKLTTYKVNSDLAGVRGVGFYELENDQNGAFRWTKGNGIIFLPNLYNIKDTIKVKLQCHIPKVDSAKVILNDNLTPFQTTKVADGFEYLFAFDEQKVLFKASIQNQSFKPQEIISSSTDTRTLGLIFKSLTFYE